MGISAFLNIFDDYINFAELCGQQLPLPIPPARVTSALIRYMRERNKKNKLGVECSSSFILQDGKAKG